MKLVEKTRIGSRYRKKYDSPQTPYQRVLQEPSILQEQKEKLTMVYQSLDPFSLRKSIKIKLNQILKFSGLK
ncbi:MAG TPA: hypothetical protein VG895_05715 [Patescibacteria group bacterium]|nr:hypothetical protein [Patescibacteria group bacterium]